MAETVYKIGIENAGKYEPYTTSSAKTTDSAAITYNGEKGEIIDDNPALINLEQKLANFFDVITNIINGTADGFSWVFDAIKNYWQLVIIGAVALVIFGRKK